MRHVACCVLVAACAVDVETEDVGVAEQAIQSYQLVQTSNRHGVAASLHLSGSIDFNNPFFVPQTPVGRPCVICHDPASGWTITPASIEPLFEQNHELFDVLEMAVCPEGACPAAQDLSTEQGRRRAFKTALARGVSALPTMIPVLRDANGNALPPEIIVEKVVDPFGYSTTTRFTRYRRPLPTVNMRLMSTFGWTGTTDVAAFLDDNDVRNTSRLRAQLMATMNSATKFHGKSTVDLPIAVREQAADFMMGVFQAQTNAQGVGSLTAQGARGGPIALATQDFYAGINDNFGRDPLTGTFDSRSMTMFNAWANAGSPHRKAVARGQEIFNRRTFAIGGVGGINDTPIPDTTLTRTLGISGATLAVIPPTPGVTSCSTCHDSPNAGSRSLFGAVDIGVADCSRADPDLQVRIYLRNAQTNEKRCVTDIGRAANTGRWADIGKFKGPTLRALAARSHYFHDGSAAELEDVVEFYNQRFSIGLTAQEKSDLVAFLRTL